MTLNDQPVPEAGQHGGDAGSIARAMGLDPRAFVDLSASMNPFAPDVARLLVDALTSYPDLVRRYPDPTVATGQLSEAIGVDSDLMVMTNGGAEAIALVAGDHSSGNVVEPEFSLYRRHLATIDPDGPRWRSNPSNPLGTLALPGDRAAVWDEAFYPIATGAWTRSDNDAYRIGSLTKLWNCPGLRLGYVIAPSPDAAHRIRLRQPQWAVNGLALAMVPELLARTDLPGWHAAISTRRASFADSLRAFGYSVQDTAVNWLLIDHPNLRAKLIPHKVVVRDCTSFGLPGIYRVALPSSDQLDHVVNAFSAAIHQ